MKLKNLFMALIAGAAVLAGCNKEEDLGPAKLEVDTAKIHFDAEENSQEVSFVATRDWMITGIPDWVAVSAESGTASTSRQTVRFSVNANSAYTRSAEIVFTIGFSRSAISLTQDGPAGEKSEGSGTLEDPYTVAGVFDYIATLGSATSPDKVYVKGVISSIAEEYTTQYGNARFNISDNGSTTGNQFTAYRVNYLGNQRWTANDTQIKLGDEVIIYGNVVNYNGTYETSQGNAFLYSLNGVDKGGAAGGGSGSVSPKGSGTESDPFNVAAAIAKAVEAGTNGTEESYYIKGKVSSVTEQFSAQYGNGTFNMVDEGASDTFIAYRIYYIGNRKWAEGDQTVNVGDEIVVYAKITNYMGNTPETVQGSAYLVSINGNGGSGETPGGNNPGGNTGGGDWASNISWSLDSSAYSETASINGTADVPLLKLGTGSLLGKATLTLPAGSTFLRFYALSWNNKPATLVVKANGAEVATIKPAVNSGVANTAPYTITGVSDSDRYTVTFPATTTLTVETTDASNTRVVIFAAIATTGADPDEGKPENPGGDTGGNTGGGDTPGEAGEYTFDFSSAANLPSWPAAKGLDPSTQVYTLNGKDFTFEVGSNVYMNGYQGSDYLFLASKTAAAPVYLGLPAISGAKLSKVTIVTGSSSSMSSHAVVSSDKEGAAPVTGGEDQQLSVQNGEFTWTLSNTEAGKMYYFVSTATNYNAQITKLVLTYTDGEGGITGGDNSGGNTGGGNTGGETPSGSVTVTYNVDQLAAAPAGGATVNMDSVISFTNSSDYGSNTVTQLRIYKGQTLTVSAKSGYEISKIEFTCTASGTDQYGPGNFAAQNGYTYEGMFGTWEGASASVSFNASAAQVRITEMSVTYHAK